MTSALIAFVAFELLDFLSKEIEKKGTFLFFKESPTFRCNERDQKIE